MTDAVIVSTARTGLAKSWKGAFNMTHGATLGGHVVKARRRARRRRPGRSRRRDHGLRLPEGATGGNIARQIALRAGLPVTHRGVTVNRFCSSGLQTIAMAAQRIIVDQVPVMVAGGVESISCVQNEVNRTCSRETGCGENKPEIYWTMLQTAENVAKRYDICASAGRIRRAQPAARGRRAGRRQVQRRDRADHRDMGVADKASGV